MVIEKVLKSGARCIEMHSEGESVLSFHVETSIIVSLIVFHVEILDNRFMFILLTILCIRVRYPSPSYAPSLFVPSLQPELQSLSCTCRFLLRFLESVLPVS